MKLSAIRWDFELPDGSRFTDPRWAGLLDSARRLIWSLHVDPRQAKPCKPGSLLPLSVQLRYLVRWTVTSNYASFGELDADAGDEFLAYLIKTRSPVTIVNSKSYQVMAIENRVHSADRRRLNITMQPP